MKYGLQLYSVRDLAEKDYHEALRRVAEIGYKTVESAGFFGHDAATVAGWLEQLGLTVCATHTGMREIDGNFEATVKFHKAIGAKRIIIPGEDLSTAQKLDEFIKKVNKYQPLLKSQGLELMFHNHSHEFLPNNDGQIVYDELEKSTNLTFELDTYWAFVAGQDPISLLDRLKGRVSMIHLKDGLKDGTGLSLGQGEAPVDKVRQKAVDMGLDIVVESEGLDPTGIEESARCFEYLKTLDNTL